MAINQKIIDELLSEYKHPEDLLGDDGIFKKLKKALLERALNAELRDHLGYEKGDIKGQKSGHSQACGRALRRGCFSGFDFTGHRRGHGRGSRLAKPAFG